ncbi:MAG: hemerythrin domain-containing protein [Deltaproteobacteria bacterium]|nr:hemerythrin domain-containing protein [Deltaproteobacteria bacterium]
MKRIAELHKLSMDHHLALVLARRGKLASEGKAGYVADEIWADIDKKFEAELEPHFKVEEMYLSPAMRDAGESELIDRLDEEHKLLRGIISKRSGRSNELLKEFSEVLEKHVRFEERILFERAQDILAPEVFRKIKEACHH